MKIIDAIGRVDDLKPNRYDEEHKVGWLSNLDLRVKDEIIDTHEGAEEISFVGYNVDTDKGIDLLVPAPYDEMYVHWLMAQIDLANGEYNKYNAEITMFNTLWEDYAKHYNREHLPKTAGKKRFLF